MAETPKKPGYVDRMLGPDGTPFPAEAQGRGRQTTPDPLSPRNSNADACGRIEPPNDDLSGLDIGALLKPAALSEESLRVLGDAAAESARAYYASQPAWTSTTRSKASDNTNVPEHSPTPNESDHSPPAAGHEALPKNWAEAVPTILFGFYGFAFAFEAVVAMNTKDGTLALLDSAACLICAGAALAWWKRREWLPDKLRTTTMFVVTDARWIVASAITFLIVSALAPYVEQQRWPFVDWFNKPAVVLVREQPTASDIANVIAPIRAQRDQAVKERDSALAEVNTLKGQLEQARRSFVPPTGVPKGTLINYSLDEAQIHALANELFDIKGLFPHSISIHRIMYDMQSMGLSQQLFRAFNEAGALSQLDFNRPVTPRDTGISIRVANAQKPPVAALKIAEALKKVTGIEPRLVTTADYAQDAFTIFIGRNPNE